MWRCLRVSALPDRAPETPPLQRTWLTRSDEPRSSPDKRSLVCSHCPGHRQLLWAAEPSLEDAHVFGCAAGQIRDLHGKCLFCFVAKLRELLGRDMASMWSVCIRCCVLFTCLGGGKGRPGASALQTLCRLRMCCNQDGRKGCIIDWAVRAGPLLLPQQKHSGSKGNPGQGRRNVPWTAVASIPLASTACCICVSRLFPSLWPLRMGGRWLVHSKGKAKAEGAVADPQLIPGGCIRV